ncbi:hypothetical protein [Cupriavidus sp. IK-TO18]|uniref:hypothetical protein n=1 Tax=Cupriavidus sp. IK-TO18 TaxID=2782182 RepID=UPI001896E2DA|nr:hypothetical protein [Cupriavidus sp. IK-TO18]MBF6987222.1 hypothetical protein [Cupriavidus sp. IK-TO18]
MIDDLPTNEAIALLAQIKNGDPGDGWDVSKDLPSVFNCAFGVTDDRGMRIQGVVADLLIKFGQKPPSTHYIFTIYKTEVRRRRRAYQLEILQNGRRNRTEHDLPHEHIGQDRSKGFPEWLNLTYDEALGMFCTKANLTLQTALGDPAGIDLR